MHFPAWGTRDLSGMFGGFRTREESRALRCVCEQSLSVTHGCAKRSAFNYSAEERLNRRSHQRATRGVVAMEMSFRASSSSGGSMISVGLGRSGGSCCLAPSHSPNTAQGKVLQCRAGSSSYRGAALPRASTEPCVRRWGSAALLGPVLPRFCAPSAPSTAITLLGFFVFYCYRVLGAAGANLELGESCVDGGGEERRRGKREGGKEKKGKEKEKGEGKGKE